MYGDWVLAQMMTRPSAVTWATAACGSIGACWIHWVVKTSSKTSADSRQPRSMSPDRIFAFLVNSYGTVAIFVYVLIAVAELRLRARLEREMPERLRIRMWGYPWLTRLAILAMLAIVAAMSVIPEQRAPLVFGLLSVLVLLGVYALRRFARTQAPALR